MARFANTPIASVLLVAATVAGCTPSKPPNWVEGGAPLAIGPAHWDRGDGDPVDIRADGHVLIDGNLTFVVDRVGRVTDSDYDAVAVLEPDGQLVGTGDQSLGRLGITNASPPGIVEAWLSVMPDGRVVYFDPDGERTEGGRWQGCSGPVLRTCTLVTHLVALQHARRVRSGVGIGIGVGVGVGVGVGF